MFRHYLKIAFRNLRKYALQNTVSILGLAAGFVFLRSPPFGPDMQVLTIHTIRMRTGSTPLLSMKTAERLLEMRGQEATVMHFICCSEILPMPANLTCWESSQYCIMM